MFSGGEENKAGLYFTVSVHLAVIIYLLISQISAMTSKSGSFLIDFDQSSEQEIHRLKDAVKEQEEAFDEEISRRIERMIAGESGQQFRNLATDRSQSYQKDDRGTNAEQLYEENRRLQQALKEGIHIDESDDFADPNTNQGNNKNEVEYTGPSVVSYNLDGRKASHLPKPVYKCYGGGMVTVIITVDNAGNVTDAKVQDATSAKDKCLREHAVMAAMKSRFSRDPKAPARHRGDIIYQFISQQ